MYVNWLGHFIVNYLSWRVRLFSGVVRYGSGYATSGSSVCPTRQSQLEDQESAWRYLYLRIPNAQPSPARDRRATVFTQTLLALKYLYGYAKMM